MIIIGPNSYEKLTKGELGRVEVGSNIANRLGWNIAQDHSSSPLEVLSR